MTLATRRHRLFSALVVSAMLCTQAAAQEPVPADERGFAGTWSTTTGPLELKQEGDAVEGLYTVQGAPGHLEGQLESGRLNFRYFGPGTDGDGWFELRDDGRQLDGRWRSDSAAAWLIWTGRRTSTLGALPVLRPGEPLEDRIDATDPVVASDGTMFHCLNAFVHAKTYGLEAPDAGPYFIDLHSEAFDAYLVLRDIDGNVLQEDDDGLGATHARIAASMLQAGRRYLVEVCALDGDSGPFVVALRSGKAPAPPPDPSAGRRALFKQAQHALRYSEAVFGREHPDTATAAAGFGYLTIMDGRMDEGIALFERALAIRERALGSEHLLTAEALEALGGALNEVGRSAEARPLVERALRILEDSLEPDDPRVANCLSTLVGILGNQRLYAEAIPLARRAYRIALQRLGPDEPFTAFLAMKLGLASQVEGRFDEARGWFDEAIRVLAATPGYQRHAIMAHDGLGRLLTEQGLFIEARAVLERSLRISEEAYGPEHVYTAKALRSLSAPLRSMGLDAEARPLFERALRISEQSYGFLHPDTAACLNDLAQLLADQGETEAAFEHARRAIASTEARVERTLPGLTESERLRFASQIRSTLELYFSLAPLVPGAAGSTSYARLLAWKGQVSRSLLAAETPRTAAEQALLERLRRAQRRLSDSYYAAGPVDPKAHRQTLEALRKESNALELQLVRLRAADTPTRAPEVAGGPLVALARGLPPHAVVVDFFVHRLYRPAAPDANAESDADRRPGNWSAPRLTAWVVRAGAAGADVVQVDLGDAAVIEAATERFLADVVTHRAVSRGVAVATRRQQAAHEPDPSALELTRLLWDPLRDAVGDSELVLLSPDSFLGTLPFETLQRADGSYLIEHRGFAYLQDMASLPHQLDVGDTREPNLLLVGGIDYGERQALTAAPVSAGTGRHAVANRGSFATRWPALAATRHEADVIARLHARTVGEGIELTLLDGGAATEERIKQELPRHRFVHLATHGYFQPEGLPSLWGAAQEQSQGIGTAPRGPTGSEARITGLLPGLLSGLVCSGANAPPDAARDNGLLTAEEVRLLDLIRCELVVLSACETALGRPESGEGMLGLRRAFQQAGATTVVSSLWSVDDIATAGLMTAFYRNLWDGRMGKLAALRRAQLDMLARNREQFGEGLPATWGAFVLSGDWR